MRESVTWNLGWPVLLACVLACVLASLCAAETPEETPEAKLAEMDEGWPTELLSSESGSARKVITKSILAAAPLSAEALAAVVTAEFRGQDLAAVSRSHPRVQSGLSIADWEPAAPTLGAKEWRASWNRYLAGFGERLSDELHTWEVQLLEAPAGKVALEVVVATWIVGRLPDGRLREDRLNLVFHLVKPAPGGAADWRVARVSSREGRTVVGPGPYFRDVTDEVLPPGYDQTGQQIYSDGGPVLADYDEDGDVDLFLPRQHAPALLFEGDGEGYFEDVTNRVGLRLNHLAQGSNSGAFFDADGDADLDLIVGGNGGLRLFLREGQRFRAQKDPLTPPGSWESLAIADYDGDGLPDVYTCNYGVINIDLQPSSYVDATDGEPNVLLRNLGGGRFADATEAAGMKDGAARWSYAASWADHDGDGDVDLYVANDYALNWLYRNNGDGTFEEVAEQVGAADRGNGMGALWADLDGDLDLDLYVSNMQSFAGNRITRLANFPGAPQDQELYRRYAKGNTFLASDGKGGFTDATDATGLKPAFWAWGNLAFDYDADADLDVFACAGFYTGVNSSDL